METLNLIQGTTEWHRVRLQHGTASEAPAMMGCSKYMTRSQLLDLKKTGIAEEIDAHTQRLFDKGHAAEASIRQVVEKLIGADLYPVTGTETIDGTRLLASFDGITMLEDIVFEHKLWNKKLAADVVTESLDPHYYWQLEQQLLVSGAKKAIFVVSDGTEENMVFMWYEPQPGLA
ncbi:MAG: YqaJ viral recombinase family protein, partial [Candidatus Pacearchaeota archaeon]|nr:YqaJ viral recombinase family protein [Candidatus Pacearchaeota archaeon]